MPSPIAVHQALSGLCYPATKSDIIARARSNAAAPELMNNFAKLLDREYDDYNSIQRDLC